MSSLKDSSLLSWPSTSSVAVANTRRRWTLVIFLLVVLVLVLIVAGVLFQDQRATPEAFLHLFD